MNINHLTIEGENREATVSQTYLIKNTVNNQYVRLGKNETYYLLSVLGELAATKELQISNIEEIPLELKDKLMEKFNEWGFLDASIKNKKKNAFEKIKRIYLVKFNVKKMLDVIYPIYSVFFNRLSFIILMCMSLGVVSYFAYAFFSMPSSSSVGSVALTFSVKEVIIILLFVLANTFLHEFAHAVTCVKYGGKVESMGLMLFYFVPCFYCDVSDVYAIKSRKKRAVVAVSGILTNLFVGNLLLIIAIVLSNFGIIKIILFYMALSLIFLSIYNLIPFVKLDGYWLISALSGTDNLMDKSVILAYTSLLSRKNIKRINMKPLKRRLLSLFGFIAFFFNQLFWIYTFLVVKNMINLSETLEDAFLGVALVIVLFDFFKTLQHYHKKIKNDYNRMLMTL